MLYNNFKKTLIIVEILIILYVGAHNLPVLELFKEEQLIDFEYTLCPGLKDYLNMSGEVCNGIIFDSTAEPDVQLPMDIGRQTPTHVKFHIAPSESWQVVILKPESMDPLEVTLVEPMKEYDKISTIPGRRYTVWVAEITNGKPLLWRGGEKLPIYNRSEWPEQRDYNVSVNFFYSNISDGEKLQLNGFFQWNKSGDADVYFDVVDTCTVLGMNHFDIWPNQKPEVLVPDLSVNKTCSFKLSGLYGLTVFEYRSPPCEIRAKCEKDSAKLRNPPYIDLLATPEDSETWQVRVKWTRAVIPPNEYKLVLRVDGNETTLYVPGNAIEAKFSGVVGEDVYEVSIYSIINDTAHISKRGIFPRILSGGGVGSWATAGWCVGAAAAALLAACCWRQRPARRNSCTDYYLNEEQLSKAGDVESMGLGLEVAEDSWEVRSDRLLLHEVIGEGAFGLVRRGSLAPGGREVAVKMLKDFPSSEEIRSFRSEMELMKSVGVHRNIVSLVGCCSGRRPLIIAEYCSRGDLLSYLRCSWDVLVSKRNAKYYNNNIDTSDYRNDLFKCKLQSENSKLVVNKLYELQGMCEKELTALDLLSFCRQIAMGMEFLASNRVVHRDLAARNILVTNDKTLKIADFGLSRDVYEENQYKQKGNGKMPVKWMALESLTRRIYTTQSDVWSFGVVMWEVVTVGGSPYAEVPAARLVRLLRAGYRMPRPNNCSNELYELMQSCWRARPRDRPTFTELHEQLDELLNSACVDQYLSLELEPDDMPPTPKPQRYIKMLIRGKRNWHRGESYERPLKAPQSNHYSSPPAALNRTLPV